MERDLPEPGSTWRHYRTGRHYRIVGLAEHALGGGLRGGTFVVYRSVDDNELWLRALQAFLARTESGAYRFEEVT